MWTISYYEYNVILTDLALAIDISLLEAVKLLIFGENMFLKSQEISCDEVFRGNASERRWITVCISGWTDGWMKKWQ